MSKYSMMWTKAVIFLFCVQTQVMSEQDPVTCEHSEDPPVASDKSPSAVANLSAEEVIVGGKSMLNISWAIDIDITVKYLAGTMILINGHQTLCKYSQLFKEEDRNGPKQKWFHTLKNADIGLNDIIVHNLPLHTSWTSVTIDYKSVFVAVNKPVPTSVELVRSDVTALPLETTVPVAIIKPAIVGVMAVLMIVFVFFYLTYKSCGDIFAMCLGFKSVAPSEEAPIPVLIVYPAETPSFQEAVVALAEFLQCHGGCSVAIDMWQQQKIGELGLMRWLAEQASAARCVLIVCPKESSKHSCSLLRSSFPEAYIPAAAYDLYPMILNMVASHAKEKSGLAKFWVVQFDKQHRKLNTLPLELRACRTFCLMKDLKKLYMDLHSHGHANKLPCLNFRSQIKFAENSVEKFKDVVEKHRQCNTLTNVVTI